MSVQLIVFPQYFDGSTPLSSPSTQLVVDGINFNNVNASSSTQSVSGALPQTFINTYSVFGFSLFVLNTWYRFSGVASEITQSSGSLAIPINTGIVQRLSNLTYGATYDLTLNVNSNTTQFTVYQYKGNQLISFNSITGTGLKTVSFNANSVADVIVIYSSTSVVGIADVSCVLSTSTPSGVFTDLSNGQVICDLYEDEDIPLSLSVDDFKNVAEKVQSYSKAFNLPATKRNNQIFDNIFEITRTDTGLNFNPYKRTKAILKQDGFLLFEGYLRMIDISEKSGEISYNVNLYSEVVALADVLGDKTFSDLDFTELDHSYNDTQIKNSWNNSGTGISYTYPNTSGFRDDYTTLKYPFVDWNHQFTLSGTNINFTSITDIFRPFINIKYLIDRIFQVIPFTYESEFFNTDDFKKLYMDFNWGSDDIPIASNPFGIFASALNTPSGVFAGTLFTPLVIENYPASIFPAAPPDYNFTTHILTNTVLNTTYGISYNFTVKNTDTVNRIVELRWEVAGVSFDYSGLITLAPNQTYTFSGGFQTPTLAVGETVQPQFKASSAGVIQQKDTELTWFLTVSNFIDMLNSLRGETGQWDFLKGLMTMFNLVTLPDEDNPSNIKIEPYSDVFLNNDSDPLDWTEKVDVSQMKLMPLTDLNKKTIFKFVEDEDDFAFNVYKSGTNHLYGSKKYDASEFTILSGEDEIIAEPFAATVIKPLDTLFPDFITPSIYSMNEDETSEGFDNSPRIMYNNGVKTIAGYTYNAPLPNGSTAIGNETEFLQFSHLTTIPTVTTARDFHFGECQIIAAGAGSPVNNNLFNLYWLPYYSELYNPDTRIMTIKVNLSPSDINTFKFNDTVFIKNRTFRVNQINYKPNDLATVEFILIP
jgi:hypothetical protein